MEPLTSTLTCRLYTFARRAGTALAETYDVTDRRGDLIGYVRLRHGVFKAVAYPANGSKPLALEVELGGRRATFTTDRERRRYLAKAATAIRKAIKTAAKEAAR
ncbi:hypothetical protein [Agromyces humi]|uniref:hypothetical protein n=1 Tax=Agromyces humi TaxID=1766800 RepID=UPI00135C1D62|nr:hypothetical protein [Agromyces humi]